MLSIRSTADMADALNSLLDPDLRRLLTQKRDQLTDDTGLDLRELVHIIVALPGDTLAAIEAEAGRALDTRDRPPFEHVARHGCWWEAVLILSDDGYGLILFVLDRMDVDPALPMMVRRELV